MRRAVRQVLDVVGKVSGAEVPSTFGPKREGDPPTLVASPARAREVLNWRAQLGLEEMIASALAWERKRRPWNLDEGGPGSAVWKSTDGGDTWTATNDGALAGNGLRYDSEDRILPAARVSPIVAWISREALDAITCPQDRPPAGRTRLRPATVSPISNFVTCSPLAPAATPSSWPRCPPGPWPISSADAGCWCSPPCPCW